MSTSAHHNECVDKMTFASAYPHYVTKVEKKARKMEKIMRVT